MPRLTTLSAAALAMLLAAAAARAADDILIADFEGADYGLWRAEGESFGPGPARGTLPGQMEVSGFEGKGLVNSFFKGDAATGTLTSPEFKIERRFITFLIGGGMHPDETCMNLLVGGKVVRTATGPNDKPGGTERLDWHSWDVADLAGQTARLQIVDRQTGGWGHVNIDHVVQSDRRMGAVQTTRDLRLEKDYVVFEMPPRQGPRTQVNLVVDGQVARTAAGSGGQKPCWISWDVSALKGKTAQVRITEVPGPDGSCPLGASLAQSDHSKGIVMIVDKLYRETYRPQFHFSAAKNWLNDPNGCVFYQGEYHLFFQHNPTGINWGNMTWGHAVSPDLVHWKPLEHAIHPDALGTIFSGSAVVDGDNTAGFQTGPEKVIVCIYTSAGKPFTQSIAYSSDRGRTFTKYEKNPVLAHIAGENRDPKVLWHAPTKKWVMALYLDKNDFALFGSPDLKAWTKLCDVVVPGAGECPDFFELPVDGDPRNTRWVFWAANNTYLLGTFNGTTFTKESGPHPSNWGAHCYAAQTWSDVPPADGRRLQIAWMNGGQYPGMPFNQQMTFPTELALRTTPDGIRLYKKPAREIEKVRAKKHAWADKPLAPGGGNLLAGLEGELFDIRAEIEVGKAARVGFVLRGEKVQYDAGARTLTCLGRMAPLAPEGGKVRLQILLDRTTIEVYASDGLVSMPTCFLPDLANRGLAVYAEGGEARLVSLEVYELRSAWGD